MFAIDFSIISMEISGPFIFKTNATIRQFATVELLLSSIALLSMCVRQ